MRFLAVATYCSLCFSFSAEAQDAPPRPVTTGLPDGVTFVLAEDYSWTIGATDVTITVPKGFMTDFASIPAPIRWALPQQGAYSRAALIHDFLYWTNACTRRQSDNLMWIAMSESNVDHYQKWFIYRGVHLGGGAAWRTNKNARRKGEPRIVPIQHIEILDGMNWTEAKRFLQDRRVADPPMHVDSRACRLGDKRVIP